ncbi:hypothetical protein [Amycolatopsis sp. NPDC049159]|uniref:hypothetical protein n=1 Tax=Amycolatopsis sp. NPDC049159 TaxID=3157210 RepID=UPI0034112F1D
MPPPAACATPTWWSPTSKPPAPSSPGTGRGQRGLPPRRHRRLAPGIHPDRGTYSSFASFSDPDGNTWLLQEITDRFPGRVDGVTYGSAEDLERALREAAAAHGEHEKETGEHDEQWPAWYARYMADHQGA